jgi:hypothetical protein
LRIVALSNLLLGGGCFALAITLPSSTCHAQNAGKRDQRKQIGVGSQRGLAIRFEAVGLCQKVD